LNQSLLQDHSSTICQMITSRQLRSTFINHERIDQCGCHSTVID
jgi:hypothetical protein